MKSKSLLMTVSLFLGLFSEINAVSRSVRVDLKDGTSEIFELSAETSINHSYSKEKKAFMLMIENNEVQTEYSINDVVVAEFVENETNLQQVKAQEGSFHLRYVDGETICVTGAKQVKVFDMGGKCVETVASGHCMTVSLADQPVGIYLVNIDNKRTIKIVKR